MNSFISSSEKKRVRRISLGFLGFLVLYAVVEAFIFRNLYFYGLEYRSQVGQLAVIDKSFQYSEPSRIHTAIFGDSQSRDALRYDLLAKYSGRDPKSIFNFSFSSGKAFDIYRTYKHYVGKLTNLNEVILVVNEHQLNSYNILNDPKFRYYAGLNDRIRIMNRTNYGELLLGWISKGFDLRSTWSKMFHTYINDSTFHPREVVAEPGGLRAETEVIEGHLTKEFAALTTDLWFENYDLNGLQTNAIEWLLSDLHTRGIKVIILQIPRSKLFEDVIEKNYSVQQKEYFDILASLARKYGAEFKVLSNSGLKLEEHFRDTNHVSPKGAIEVSRMIAEEWLVK